jgi:hypothetical protein
LPFVLLAPETLVWKLSGNVVAAAAGIAPRTDHTFRANELASLFEQLVMQLQDFPAPPGHYRLQLDEPSRVSGQSYRRKLVTARIGKAAYRGGA